MPALPAVNHVVKMALKHTLSEDIDVVNLHYFSFSGTSGVSDMDGAINAYETTYASAVLSHLSAVLTLTEITMTDLTSSSAPTTSVTFSAVGGNTTNPPLGAAVSAVVKRLIARRYRGGHPRFYLPGLHAASVTDPQKLDPTFLGIIEAGIAAASNAVAGHTFGAMSFISPVNVSYFQGFTNHTFPSGRVRAIPNLRPGGPIVDLITNYVVNPHVGSQRRRNLQSA